MTNNVRCPAVFVGALAAGQGKTSITAGLARYHRNRGLNVKIFKTGPDYQDPVILEQASGNPVEPLHLWMVGEGRCRQMLYDAAKTADLILIEGVTGLFDGNPSGADLAEFFDIPIIVGIDSSAMAQTFASVAYGICHYKPDINILGVVANRLGSDRHRAIIQRCIPDNVNLLGTIKGDEAMELPHHFVGRLQPNELAGLEDRLEAAAGSIANSGLTALPPTVEFRPGVPEIIPRRLEKIRIGVARDSAFNYIYSANIKILKKMGAEIIYFSPLLQSHLPKVDSLWIPGGYPEHFILELAINKGMSQAIYDFYHAGKPVLAECGGMLYLQESLTDANGSTAGMVGILQGHATMNEKGSCHGMQIAPLPEGEIKAHALHHSRIENTTEPITHGIRSEHAEPGEPIYRSKRLTASYLHLYFPSNIVATAALFKP